MTTSEPTFQQFARELATKTVYSYNEIMGQLRYYVMWENLSEKEARKKTTADAKGGRIWTALF